MLIEPDIEETDIITCLQIGYGLNVEKVSFLPLGADFNTAVYRITADEKEFFLKLRRGNFSHAAVTVPKHLADLGIQQVIPPLTTQSGKLWENLGSSKAILYPYIEGINGIKKKLSDPQWIELGAAMKKIHSVDLPKSITNDLKEETFTSRWMRKVKTFLQQVKSETFEESTAAETVSLLKSKSNLILKLIKRAKDLSLTLQKQPTEYVLCHADIHGWNVLIDKNDTLFIVDWDTLILAPKERDLMFIGSGIGDTGRTPIEEERLFYQGYGEAEVNHDAISYYRYSRIVEDIGEYSEQIFLSDEDKKEKRQSLEYLQSNFLPDGTIERACKYDRDWK